MPTDIAVFLPCEHWATVSHEQGDRLTQCPTCHAEYVVRAEPVNMVRYLVLDEEYDDNGKLVRQEWRTMADIQAEIEARQNLAAKQHALEDENRLAESLLEDEPVRELDCPAYQLPEPIQAQIMARTGFEYWISEAGITCKACNTVIAVGDITMGEAEEYAIQHERERHQNKLQEQLESD